MLFKPFCQIPGGPAFRHCILGICNSVEVIRGSWLGYDICDSNSSCTNPIPFMHWKSQCKSVRASLLHHEAPSGTSNIFFSTCCDRVHTPLFIYISEVMLTPLHYCIIQQGLILGGEGLGFILGPVGGGVLATVSISEMFSCKNDTFMQIGGYRVPFLVGGGLSLFIIIPTTVIIKPMSM